MAESFPFPIPTFYFNVNIQGIGDISFQEVSGLEMSAELLEYRHGNNPNFITQKRVGMRKASTISMKKGVFKGDSDLLNTYNKIIDKEYYSSHGNPISLIISLFDEKKETIMKWNIANAVPLKMSGPTLKSDTNEVAIETIEFAHEGIETSFE